MISGEATRNDSYVPVRNQPAEDVPVERKSPGVPEYGVIVSTRPHVGKPNYSFHPAFVDSGMFLIFVDALTPL